jgi:DNA-binding MarR family transcriptional regulator
MKQPEQIASVISRIHENANRIILDELAGHGMEGLVPSHGGILSCLFANDGLPMSEIAKKIHRKKNTITVLVEKLETYGYVTRVADSEDNRISLVYLTAKGKSIRGTFTMISDKLISSIYKGISKEEKLTLMNLLDRINENLAG